MRERTIMASAFKARCLALLDQVAVDHVPLLITKRGRPIARLVPVDDMPPGQSTEGSVHLVAEEDQAYFTTDVRWGDSQSRSGRGDRQASRGRRRRYTRPDTR